MKITRYTNKNANKDKSKTNYDNYKANKNKRIDVKQSEHINKQ